MGIAREALAEIQLIRWHDTVNSGHASGLRLCDGFETW